MAIIVVRKPDAIFNPQFWAEDAIVFYAHVEQWGWHTLFMPQVGYHHALPRIIALFAELFDPAYIPTVYNYSAFAIHGAVLASLLSRRLPIPALGPALALASVCGPQVQEVFTNLTNIQWVTALFLIITCLKRPPETIGGQVGEGFALLLVGLTGPFSVALAPLYWLRQVWRKDARCWMATLVVTIAAGFQVYAIFHAPPVAPVDHPPQATLLQVLGLRLFAQTFLPHALWIAQPVFLTVTALIGVMLMVWFAIAPGLHRQARLLLLGTALLVIGSIFVRMKDALDHLMGVANGERYFYDTRVVLFWLILHAAWSLRRWSVVAGSAMLVSALMVSLANGFQAPPWPDMQWKAKARPLREGKAGSIPINPPGWRYDFPAKPGRGSGH